VRKLLRDTTGSVLVSYTLVFPLFITVMLGTVDVTYMLYEWVLANKVAYVGVRTAVVNDPVARNINNPTFSQSQPQLVGQPCYDPTTGAPGIDPTTGAPPICPLLSSVCTPSSSSGSCTNGFAWDDNAFVTIFTPMQNMFPGRLARQNVQITYETNNLGFYGQTKALGGLSMNVTVTIQCMTHQFFFIDALMNWAFSPPPNCPTTLSGPTIPNFASTLQSEDMRTN
jgi:TadE-like protein